jgi:hypothetical protein
MRDLAAGRVAFKDGRGSRPSYLSDARCRLLRVERSLNDVEVPRWP